ncbi:LOW QUALITY PROTEIN: hypothetical protein CVT25_012770 [Psilocybe cyanescens]|uniref:Uncharacterized protein n=1 Tax=Psilocybe cyanescens TaxID=93625 RepID=A0A409X4E6_PSICY|nr:LOW QUALITY PROTEIN: hypothetical protein CVT25_012770 [Psilocybe cyanescens]
MDNGGGSENTQPSGQADRTRITVGYIASDRYTSRNGIDQVSLQEKLERLNSEIVGTEWDSVVTFNQISTILYEATQQLTTMAKYKEENQDHTVSINVAQLHQNAMDDFNGRVGGTYLSFVNDFCAQYRLTAPRTIKNVINTSGKKPEATGRLIIDQFILLIIDFLLETGDTPLLFPELRISSKGKPVRINYANYATFITGTVDYALFATSGETRITYLYYNINGVPMANIQYSIQEDKDRSKLQTINDLLELGEYRINTSDTIGTMVAKDDMHLLLVEAKKKSYDSNLASLIPQVAAEALAA